MSKYRGPRLRIIRRLGELSAFTKKIPKRNTRPGQHGSVRRKLTQFAYRLSEKQKLRFYYGVSEKQLVRYMKVARRTKGSTGQTLLQELEIRLDNTVYRLGLAPTLPASRQLVNHGHILVDKERVTIPSFSCVPQQIIRVQKETNIWRMSTREVPSHLSWNTEKLTATVNQWSDRNRVLLNLNELLVVEYYSNRL